MTIIEYESTFDQYGEQVRRYAHARCHVDDPEQSKAQPEEVQFGARCVGCGEFLSGRFLNVYTTEKFYAGPEEGGWWGTNYSVVGCLRVDDVSRLEVVRELLRLFYLDGDPVVILEDDKPATHWSTLTAYT